MSASTEERLTADGQLEFFARSGFSVHRHAQTRWYEAGPRFLLAVPTHRPIEIAHDEAVAILRSSGALGLRYVSAGRCGRESWRMVLDDPEYALEKLSGNTRSKIRRGLKHNDIRRVSGADLKKFGEQAFLDTVARQGRSNRYGIDRWHRLLDAADRTPGIEIWSAWHEDRLAAYLLIMLFEDACEFYEARSRNDCLRLYPNNALIYHLAHSLLSRRIVPRITFGIEGLEELDTLDQFKLTMGFHKEPIRQAVRFRPGLHAVLTRPPGRQVVSVLAERSGSSLWHRVESLVRLAEHVQG
ncbi:MAG: GNAT family N-acetyltransferase [Candidatus Dadabacteria bacterium]|nr:MAG: GNAT family N-acetyltransferase [Candidatus Dadabacteria bacterium]